MSTSEETRTRTIRTDYLTRVEGEGAMYVEIDGDEVRDVKFRIYEPPRFFEALLRGRAFTEAPDVTSRICGICPIAYQISAVLAMENACGITIDSGPIRELRRLIYCGEWIESQGMHVYMLHAPDFMGYPGLIEMARDHPKLAEQGLALKKAGNAIVTTVGGREIHPVNLRVGGFYRAPTRRELHTALHDQLERGREIALETVKWTSTFTFPEIDWDPEFVALSDGDRYPIDYGRIVSDRGIDISPAEFNAYFVESHVEHSNALHSHVRERGNYVCGGISRYNLCADKLWPLAREAARDAGLGDKCTNPFRSIIVRSVDVLQAFDEALSIIDNYDPPDRPAVEVVPRHAVGHGASEAPRGMLYHRYEIDEQGTILDAKIVPPTSQNQASVEQDLRAVVERNVDRSDDQLRHVLEQAIRNYDPCISCSTHFLDLTVNRH
jgi:coenzyme F420-reducing hydrogenase alpha subunit